MNLDATALVLSAAGSVHIPYSNTDTPDQTVKSFKIRSNMPADIFREGFRQLHTMFPDFDIH